MGKKENAITIRSSAAEYLTFVASAGDSAESFEMRYEDENIWLTQKMMAALYDVSKQTISQHIQRIYDDGELIPEATVKKYLTVQTEGNRQISRNLDHYSLQMIIAVGFKVNNQRAVQFRKWAGQIVKGHTIQGWTMLGFCGCGAVRFTEFLSQYHFCYTMTYSSNKYGKFLFLVI